MEKLSKTQIDRLGDRLRKGLISETDLRVLDDYRKSYGLAYDEVVGVIREKLKLNPVGRPAKSTSSIVDKLKRESIRLSQVQDIAGCRLIVSDTKHQDNVVSSLCGAFISTSIVDRRIKPSHGYRAVHVIVKISGKPIEVQVRTELQHQWAELSEKCSDKIDPLIKYGGGDRWFQIELKIISETIKLFEVVEIKSFELIPGQKKLFKMVLKRLNGVYANVINLTERIERRKK